MEMLALVSCFLLFVFLESWHSNSYKNACAPREDSEQAAHPHRPFSLRCPPEDTLDFWLPTECPAKTD